MRRISILVILLISIFRGVAQESSNSIINGYVKDIDGVDIAYNSSIPQARDAMLVRASSGTSSMCWETDVVPVDYSQESVTFVWLAGIGTSSDMAYFSLELNGEEVVKFSNKKFDKWSEDGTKGIELSFKSDFIDGSKDRFGYMSLTVPTSELKRGESSKIKVTGAKMEQLSWYMTFKFPLVNGFNISSAPAVKRVDGELMQLGKATMVYFDKPVDAKIFIEDELISETKLKFGYNYIGVSLPKVDKEREVSYRVEAGDFVETGRVLVKPVREWRVNFVQHSHTDIGYTRPQTEILGEHLRYIDYALDYCDNTDDYPEESKFRWTCEATWPVNEFLRTRPKEQIDRLKRRIEEGRIEITGMYFNFDELSDEQTLAASLQPIKKIHSEDIDVTVAMQNDVNGIGWCFNDYYKDLGIKYLNMGTHGHRALICFDVPTLFWWESPSGNKMLAYRGEHYMTGNTVFRIHDGNFEEFEQNLLGYLSDLEGDGYKYDLISIQHSGYLTDNSPPSTKASDMIRRWNEVYEWPKLKTSLSEDFFVEMESNYGETFETIRGAWPDWWTDGFGASAREVATTRKAQSDLISNMGGLTMASILGSNMPEDIDKRIYWANDALLFYTEHTVGFAESVRDPWSSNTMDQRALKESYAWEAGRRSKLIGEEALGLLQSHINKEADPSIVIYNTLNWERGGLVNVYIDHQIAPRERELYFVDISGERAAAQIVESRSDGTYWAVWVDDIPPFGYKKFTIEPGELVKVEEPVLPEGNSIENEWYKITFDKESASISSIFDKDLNLELVDSKSEWKMGQFIYETLGNRFQMESMYLDDYKREGLDSVWIEKYVDGDVWSTIHFKGDTEAAIKSGGFEFQIRLFKSSKRVDLAYYIEKKSVTDPEGIYIALPFKLDDGTLAFDVQGGEVIAGVDQIKGSSNDWNTVQNYARLSNSSSQILLSSPEIPMMQFGAINTGRYVAGATPETTHIYGWPMNNYWTTNFNAEQRGGFSWVYNLSSVDDSSQLEATKFGWNSRVPLLTRVLPGGGSGDDVWEQSIIEGWPEGVVLISSTPNIDGASATINVREVSGESSNISDLKLRDGRSLKITQVNVLGEPIKRGSLSIKPFESKFYKLEW